MERLGAVPHATFVYGPGLTDGAGGQRRALALHELVRSLCHERHVVTLELPRATGARSAEDVLAWQTGYGGAVDLRRRSPGAGHGDAAAGDEGVDVTLPIEARARAGGRIALAAAGAGVEVWIRTAAAGVSAAGTVHRLDGVPLTLQAPLPDGAPTAAALLARLLDEVGR